MSDDAALKEIDQALDAIRKALYAVNESEEKLRTARGWSTYDTWLGGGWIASMFKRERVDKVDQSLRSVDWELANVRKKLATIDIQDVGDLGIGSTARTLDVWFDNIFTDLLVNSRLKNAQQRVSLIARALVTLQSKLEARRRELVAGS